MPRTDWLAEVGRRARPFALGHGFWIDPRPGPGRRADPPAGRRRLVIPVASAFGTGEHASTRLLVDVLETSRLAGRSVVDVGTGTGLLGLVALAVGAARVVALDIDCEAAIRARDNACANDLPLGIVAGAPGAIDPRRGRFDLALVNILPELVAPHLPAILALLGPGGRAAFSGIVEARAGLARENLEAAGFAVVGRRQMGEWIALLAHRR